MTEEPKKPIKVDGDAETTLKPERATAKAKLKQIEELIEQLDAESKLKQIEKLIENW